MFCHGILSWMLQAFQGQVVDPASFQRMQRAIFIPTPLVAPLLVLLHSAGAVGILVSVLAFLNLGPAYTLICSMGALFICCHVSPPLSPLFFPFFILLVFFLCLLSLKLAQRKLVGL